MYILFYVAVNEDKLRLFELSI